MSINFKDIKKNFFIDYLKYWIILFIILLIYFIIALKQYYIGKNQITMNIERAIFVTNGVAINNKYVIADKKIIEESCISDFTSARGNFYIVDNQSIYRAVIDRGDTINNMVLLRLKNYRDNLKNYAILQLDQPKYPVNKRLIVPFMVNRPGKFNFKKVRIVDNIGNNFFIAIKNTLKITGLSGMPVFNKNYVLQGIIKDTTTQYKGEFKRDKILNKLNVQETYVVNNVDTIKNFLNRYNIEYSVVSGNINLNNKKYNAKLSVVNIICVTTY